MDEIRAIEAALDAGAEVLRRHYRGVRAVEKKSSIDLVTEADEESEARIVEVLSSAVPEAAILAEEAGGDRTRGAKARFVIDSLDGTTNYAHGFPQFSISIAFERDGVVVAAGIDAPYLRERFLAERGAGATMNGERLRVSTVASLASSLLVTGFPYDRRERIEHYLAHWKTFLCRAHGVLRLGSAALDLCAVAAGRLEAFWEENLQPWDTMAGMLVVEEAGGRVTDFAGSPFDPFGKQLLATNGLVHDECLAALAENA